MLTIDEITESDGSLTSVVLDVDGGVLRLARGADAYIVPDGVLEAAMRRYGFPFDPAEPVTSVGELVLAGGRRLRRVRHLARYDVIARDYLVLEAPDDQPRCALAVTVASALAFVARAAAAAPPV